MHDRFKKLGTYAASLAFWTHPYPNHEFLRVVEPYGLVIRTYSNDLVLLDGNPTLELESWITPLVPFLDFQTRSGIFWVKRIEDISHSLVMSSGRWKDIHYIDLIFELLTVEFSTENGCTLFMKSIIAFFITWTGWYPKIIYKADLHPNHWKTHNAYQIPVTLFLKILGQVINRLIM